MFVSQPWLHTSLAHGISVFEWNSLPEEHNYYLLSLIIFHISVFIKAVWKEILDKYILEVPKYKFSRAFKIQWVLMSWWKKDNGYKNGYEN